MAPKRKMALLSFPRSNMELIPAERHIRSNIRLHRIYFRKGLKNSIEAFPPFEFVNSESTGSEIPQEHHTYKTFFRDNKDGAGSLINPRSILQMWIDKT